MPDSSVSPSTPPIPRAAHAYRDTDPVAIWGFVLTFVLWPVGLLLCLVALRRVRRTGHGGWGLAVAGASLCTLAGIATALAGAVLVVRTDLPAQWVASGDATADAAAADRVAQDLADDLTARHDTAGEWPDDPGRREIDDVRAEAYRTGDELCVDATRGGYEVSLVAGELRTGTGCVDRGFSLTFRAARQQDDAVREQARQAALVDELRARAAVVAASSSLDGKPDLGLGHAERADLEVCSAVTVTWDRLDDVDAREALYRLLQQVDADVRMTTYTDDFQDFELHDPTWDPFARRLLALDADCWRGGYVGPAGPSPVLPTLWTTPLTQAMRDAEAARAAGVKAGDAAAIALTEAQQDEEEAQVTAAIAART
ncbi:DUF4190 domain-containing protein [Cellulomonas sp.]|uniref:DUF4190 domain-containing protein n=1 Tax=Cellulomonas sp. TaxID=40001 RepID=UPI001AFEC597|nr:DUF4190 domain-containing protein [Cellulomonas sp.]MBO9555442.1 DUF4190 domain-containing protein [Cellulomonas sp.]